VRIVTFKVNIDSSVMISHLSRDVHKDDVLAAVGRLALLQAELFFSLICYAEVWTAIELLRDEEKRKQVVYALQDTDVNS
jgi:hypothetical protein